MIHRPILVRKSFCFLISVSFSNRCNLLLVGKSSQLTSLQNVAVVLTPTIHGALARRVG